jgi:alkylation response protein AidB-like acyl-CoA dehydrogenase
MDFGYTEEQRRFRRELRDWLRDNLPDGWLEAEQSLPEDRYERVEFLRDWQRTLYDGGWAGFQWPEEYGGRGASLIKELIYQEETSRVNAPEPINGVGLHFVGPTLIECGTDAQKDRFLSEILSADEVWCQGFSEPSAGSDVASLTCELDRDGDRFIINGQKIWTSYAHAADWCFLAGRTDDSGTKHEGITTLLVDMDQPVAEVEPIHQASDCREFNQTFFDNAVAAEDKVVGEVDEGWSVIMTLSSFEHGMSKVEEARYRYRKLLEYCRRATRDGTPLIEHEHVRQRLADFDVRLQAAKRTHLRHVSEQVATGFPGPEGSMDMVVSDELVNDLESFALNLTGPETALWEDHDQAGASVYDYLQSYGWWIAAGTGDIHRNIIGEQVLGLPSDIKSEESHKE